MRDVLLHTVQETIIRHQMLVAEDRVVLAVSGGVDSMVMLHLLLRLQPRYRLSLHVAHLNHNLRGTESAKAADFVRRQCEAYQVPAIIMTAAQEVLRDARVGSLQAAARDLRYQFLTQVADEQGAQRIALGHHRDDQAETVLMNLLRGSGVRGLGGIPPVRGRIIRPLIDCSRDEIDRYARQERVPFVEDSSNRTLSYRRNRIRLELLPELAKRYNPRIVHTLADTAAILEAEDQLLNEIADRELHAAMILHSSETVVLSSARLVTLPSAMRWRLIRRSAEILRKGRSDLTFRQILSIDRLVLTGGTRGTIHASGGLRASRVGDGLVFAMGEGRVRQRLVPVPLAVPGLTIIDGSSLCLSSDLLEEWSGSKAPSDVWTALIDADRIGQEVHVRGWEKGDRFIPLGMRGRKKLQDLFVDAKIPRETRGNIPLVVARGDIAWVVGVRMSEQFKVTESTKRVLRIRASASDHP
jgi:tRNA(Ile)-lysidine synthase